MSLFYFAKDIIPYRGIMVSHECIKARAEKFGNMRKYRKFRNLGKSGKIGKFGNPQKRRYVPRWTQGGIRMTSVRQAKHHHNVQKWTQIIMEQRASGLSGLAYCRRAEINFGTDRATRIRIAGRGSLRFIRSAQGRPLNQRNHYSQLWRSPVGQHVSR